MAVGTVCKAEVQNKVVYNEVCRLGRCTQGWVSRTDHRSREALLVHWWHCCWHVKIRRRESYSINSPATLFYLKCVKPRKLSTCGNLWMQDLDRCNLRLYSRCLYLPPPVPHRGTQARAPTGWNANCHVTEVKIGEDTLRCAAWGGGLLNDEGPWKISACTLLPRNRWRASQFEKIDFEGINMLFERWTT